MKDEKTSAVVPSFIPHPSSLIPSLFGSLALATAMTTEGPRRRELSELVADRVLRHIQADELPAVVNQEGRPDELRDNRAVPRPGLDRLPVARTMIAFHLRQQTLVNVRTFLQRPAHHDPPLGNFHYRKQAETVQSPASGIRVMRPRTAPADDRRVRRLPLLAGLATLGQHAGGAARVPAAAGPALPAAHRMADRVH